MVFKIINSDVSGLSRQMGIFGASYNEIFSNIKKNTSSARGGLNKFKAVFSGIGQSFKKEAEQPIANASKAIDGYNSLVAQGIDVQKRLKNVQNPNSMTKYLQSLNGAKASAEGYNNSLKPATLGTKALTVATKALGVALNMALNVGITLALNGIISLITSLVNSYQNSIDKIKERNY